MFENIIEFGKRVKDAKYLADCHTGKIIRPLEMGEIEEIKEYYAKIGNYLEICLKISPFTRSEKTK